MAWQLSWIGEDKEEEEVGVFARSSEAQEHAADICGEDLDWTEALWIESGDDEEILVAGANTSPDGGYEDGEYLIARVSGGGGFRASYVRVQPVDRENPLVPLIARAIDERKHLAYVYTNSKRKTHPAVLRPTGWHTFEHSHDWAGGYTLCVKGYCYYHREERFYAIRRMADVRVLDSADQELIRLGWTRGGLGATAAPLPAVASHPVSTVIRKPDPKFEPGAPVRHPVFGNGRIRSIDRGRDRVTVDFKNGRSKDLTLSLAPLDML